jgi:tRNA-specific 2-thiouridylase
VEKTTVVIGLSGGVDSSVAAYLLKKEGYTVIGVTLKLWEQKSKFNNNNYIENSKKIAEKLDVEHIIIDAKTEFENTVVRYFINEYICGRTPSPCSFCNNMIKWKILSEITKNYINSFVATGHYVNIKKHNNNYYIEKGIDKIKDQSYFLWEISEEILKKTKTPLGGYTKNEVLKIAEKIGLNNILSKNESMGVCFLEKTDYRKFITEHFTQNIEKGIIYNEKGKEIGLHEGIPYYTIGQKNGLNLTEKGNFYVNKIDVKTNSLVVGSKDQLIKHEVFVNNLSFINLSDLETYNNNLIVKIRGYGLNPTKKCSVIFIDDNTLKVSFNDHIWAPASGQPVVFYYENILLGGGLTI